MALWQNIPFFCIIGCIFSAAVTSVLPKKAARAFCLSILCVVTGLSFTLCFLMRAGGSYPFMMGHFPAPWGNMLRAGLLEAVVASGFSLVMVLSLLAGGKRLDEQVERGKHNLYYVVCELLTAALMAQVYTNDLFTAYVFVEIMTIAACALITARQVGRTLVAATRYMIMNLVGSGLFLLGITLLYDLTGHLLMENIHDAVAALHETGEYALPLAVVIALLNVGLCIKSALFPFHTWVPDAYSYATPSSGAILSSLVSKGYIFLLIKIDVRVIGLDIIRASGIFDVLMVFALLGMVIGSLMAIRERDIRRMIAYSSVAQIGYIYMGISMGTPAGVAASVFHILSHAVAKSTLFMSQSALSQASGDSKEFRDLRGAGLRAPLAGVAFTVSACSMVGVPLVGGFIAKILYAQAAMGQPDIRMIFILLTLALSTLLNTMYFLRTVITLYRPAEGSVQKQHLGALFCVSMGLMILTNIALGVVSHPLIRMITTGLQAF